MVAQPLAQPKREEVTAEQAEVVLVEVEEGLRSVGGVVAVAGGGEPKYSFGGVKDKRRGKRELRTRIGFF